MTVHTGVTIIVNIKPGRQEELKELFQEMVNRGVGDNDFVPFAKVRTAHYARWVMLDAKPDAYGKQIPAQLLYSASVDGLENNHIKELIAVARLGIEKIYECCEGFPPASDLTEKSLYNYLRKNKIISTFYSGIVGISLQRVRDEGVLYERIQAFLDKTGRTENLGQLTCRQVRSKIQHFVRGESDLQWALKRHPFSLKGYFQVYRKLWAVLLPGIFLVLSLFTFMAGKYFIDLPPALATTALVGTALLGALLFFALSVILLMRLDELKPHIPVEAVNDERILEMQTKETQIVQAQYTARENMKPRWIRTVWQTTVLFLVRQISVTSFIPTVHAARWFYINGRRQLIFVSNFDGDSEAYLHGFIDLRKIARSMNLMYGSALGFPRTKWLLGEGAKDRQGYMKSTRAAQAITNVWYSAVQNLSVENIKNNKRIREGLFGRMSEKKAEAWLRQL